MRCFFCNSDQSIVLDKRTVKSSGEVRRRRECVRCHGRFTTYERICEFELYVLKRSGKRELFDRQKLTAGLQRALEKRPAFEQIDEIVSKIITDLRKKGQKEVESKIIGRYALSELKKIDKVGYLRFASVYRHFEDPRDFAKELVGLNK